MIKAVIFDIDGVLLDSFEANLKFVQDLLKRAGYPAPSRKEFPELFHRPLYDIIKIRTKLTSEEEIKKIWEMGRNREVPYRLELLKTPDGVEEVIKILSHNYDLGIVTSRVREGVFEAPALKKLEQYFKVAVAYQDTREHKPHPEPLLYAAKELKIIPEKSVYIGDVENDVKAGKAAGMKVIIYSKDPVQGADACITRFVELPQCIETL